MQNRDAPPPSLAEPPETFDRVDTLEALSRELNAVSAPSAEGFAPVLTVTTQAMHVDGRCADCCHWSLPLSAIYRDRVTEHGVALAFSEWIVWAWHVQQHQRAHQPLVGGVA